MSDIRYDPYDLEVDADPYPTFARIREESPVFHNDEHDFYAVARYDDVERGLKDRATFISGRGGVLEIIKANITMPPGNVIFEDPPTHAIHRGLMSRMFTPKKVAALEPQIREFCARSLDPLIGESNFDMIASFGSQMPMRVIGMLLGIPEDDQEAVRDRADANLRVEGGVPREVKENFIDGSMFGEYLDWREKHPSDDIMTELLNAEYEDENGEKRRLTKDELMVYLMVVAGAGNETTNRLIGWFTKILAENPDQRRLVAEDRSLINNTIEEVLRYEPPAPHVGRVVAKDTEFHGQTIPADSAILFLVGGANRDPRKYDEPDRFDVRRNVGTHLAFGLGPHFCLGASLARLEGRIALDEILNRFPEWDVDLSSAKMAPTSTVRGWESLPVVIP